MSSTVYIVHCIDTEGPLYESIEATFERLKSIFGLELEPSKELLRRLQSGGVELGGLEQAVQKVVDPQLLSYNDTWDKVDEMLAEAMSAKFRSELRDAKGEGWIYNWFCVDHVDYDANPRRRDMGYHNVFDHYRSAIRERNSRQDGLHFHYHPHSFRREAHRCATHWWASSDSLGQVISRRVIDRRWFPAAHRPGFHVIRPDSHWFLEQFVPFDYSNQAGSNCAADKAQAGVGAGRLGDWRRAPRTWEPYHPAADDYQIPGSCRRWIARCLNVGTRYRLLTPSDVRQAFLEAQSGKPAVLAFTNHDFRDIRTDVGRVRSILSEVAAEFPSVRFAYAEAIEAMRNALALKPEPPCDLNITMRKVSASMHVMEVTTQTPTFGPQPWLALKTSSGTYHYDNFDFETPFHSWRYVFDDETFPLHSLDAVGVAANNWYGGTTVTNFCPATGEISKHHWNCDSSQEIAEISQDTNASQPQLRVAKIC